MRMTAAWKRDTAPAFWTSFAVRPKNVAPPVAVTNDGVHFALLGDRAGIDEVSHLFRDRQGFAGQGGLIDAQIVS
jgi:hypothetical protein